jgi:hypothetical protein
LKVVSFLFLIEKWNWQKGIGILPAKFNHDKFAIHSYSQQNSDT